MTIEANVLRGWLSLLSGVGRRAEAGSIRYVAAIYSGSPGYTLLKRLSVVGFKSFSRLRLSLPRFTVLFGPNAAGKSNIIDALQALSRVATSRTLAEAMRSPIRGYPVEAFTFPTSGLPGLLNQATARFTLQGDLAVGKEDYRYRVGVEIQPSSGALSVIDEYLCRLNANGEPRGIADIEVSGDKVNIRRKSKPGRPRRESVGLNYAMVSDPRLGAPEYRGIERVRSELSAWRTYYLDPRVAMRRARPPADVTDIGELGHDIAPFLYRLRSEHPKHFDSLRKTLRTLVPSVEDVFVELDKKRGTLDVSVRQNGIEFSSRIISEGTLRVLAMVAIAVNPWKSSLLAFEEPENGVHPKRIELIAQLLTALALEQDQQLIVTTHSLAFCNAVLREAKRHPENIALVRVKGSASGTDARVFEVTGPLFGESEVTQGLTDIREDGRFESLALRGLLDV